MLVAITVILAAVLAAFVLDTSPSGGTVEAFVTVDDSGTDTVDITVDESGSAEFIVLVNAGSGTVADSSGNNGEAEPANTGTTYTISSDTGKEAFVDSAAGTDTYPDGEYEVWAVSEELSPGDPLDDTEETMKVAEFTLASP